MAINFLYSWDRLESSGYAWEFLSEGELAAFRNACNEVLEIQPKAFGVRDVVGLSTDLRFLSEKFLLPIARRYLHPQAFLVRSTLFDKPESANWAVPWHQDVTIEVAEKHELEGFGPWSIKDGVTSVQPPSCVLENMLTLRLHLDETTEENGALLVEPGSHLRGKLRISEIEPCDPVLCGCKAGEILMMKPLLFHASNRSQSGQPRRVLHLDFAYQPLPNPLQWRSQRN